MTENSINLDVLAANDRFYLALSQADSALMSHLWSHDDDVYCIHPGWDRLEGWEAIFQSWQAIFNHQGPCPIAASAVKVNVCGEVAWVNCFENIALPEADHRMIRTMCTNVFQYIDGDWKLVIHHSSVAPLSSQGIDSSDASMH
ncbi:MAG: nuclear transport factor 2 family protein [Pseudomonadales bacterium]|nr:nuclear transport factor 2 family protein [Pseudomonadales bacterium]